jgi:hypothetical protein
MSKRSKTKSPRKALRRAKRDVRFLHEFYAEHNSRLLVGLEIEPNPARWLAWAGSPEQAALLDEARQFGELAENLRDAWGRALDETFASNAPFNPVLRVEGDEK